MKLNRGIRIALWVVPFVLFYAYIWRKGFEYPVVDDIMINQTILSHENMLLPYVGIGLSTLLVALQKVFQGWNIYFIFLVLSYCGSISIFNDFFYKKKLYVLIPLTLLMQCVLIKYFSFSVISYLVAAAGILLLFNESLVMGILSVAIGISIRPQIASSLIVLVLPFLIYEILKNKKWKEMLILIGIVLSINVSNKVYSMTRSDVQEYLKWNELSTNLRDFPEINYEKHREELENLEKMGQKSVDNLINSIESSKTRDFSKVLYALGIPFVGKFNANLLTKTFKNIENLKNQSIENLLAVKGIGDKVAVAVNTFLNDENNWKIITDLQNIGLQFAIDETNLEKIVDNPIKDKTKFTTINLKYPTQDTLYSFLKYSSLLLVFSISIVSAPVFVQMPLMAKCIGHYCPVV